MSGIDYPDLVTRIGRDRDRLIQGLRELLRSTRMHACFDVEEITSVMGGNVAPDRRELQALMRLLDQCPDPEASVEYVADRYGSQGVVLRWDDADGSPRAELWWFEDEAHADLYRWDPEDSA